MKNALYVLVLISIFVLSFLAPAGEVYSQAGTPTVTAMPGLSDLFYYMEIQAIDITMPNVATWGVRYPIITAETGLCPSGDRTWGFGLLGAHEYHKAPPFGDAYAYFEFNTDAGNFTKFFWVPGTGFTKNLINFLPYTWQTTDANSYHFYISSTEYFARQISKQLIPEDTEHYSLGAAPSTIFMNTGPTHLDSFSILLDTGGGSFVGDLIAYCYGTHAPITGLGIDYLGDSGMEQQPISSYWFPNTGLGSGAFGRIDDGNLLTVGYGDPKCGNGWQIIGGTNRCAWSILEYYNAACARAFIPIRQRFTWPGGKMYWRMSAKGMPESGWDRNVNALFWVTNTATNAQTQIFSGAVPPEWTDYSGSTSSLAAGAYVINVTLGVGNADYDSIMVDDVVIADVPTSGSCQEIEPATTATAPVGGTPTLTVTPNGFAGENLIDNCGFEQGELYWSWQYQKSFVIFGINNYSHANYDAPNPGVSQTFNWIGGNAYLRIQSHSDFNAYFRNVVTGSITEATSGTQPYSGWVYHDATVYLPQGAYELRLHHPSGSAYSEYDNISLSAGNYGSCNAGSNATSTPPPTATTTATATMFPTATRRPTSTVPTGQATSTPIPSFTPYPTYTPRPTSAATNTPRPNATNTPYPTYTAAPTYTPQPTYTPNAQGTIEISPTPSASPPPPQPQPPPSYYTDCTKPQSGAELAGWLEYEKCQMLSYFDMSPKAVATYGAIPTAFAGREPFGVIGEVSQTNRDMKGLLDSYDWENTGLPGVDDAINLDQFLTPTGPLVTGQFDFSTNSGIEYSTECEAGLAELVGPYLSGGVCFVLNIMRTLGIIPWMQLFINITAIGFLGLYIYKKWIDAGAGG